VAQESSQAHVVPDPAARARDQLGAAFLALSVALAAGGVAAGADPHATFLKHHVWWWVGFSLLFYTPALLFFVVPWAMRRLFGLPPRGAVEDATRAWSALLAFALALAVVDAGVLGAAAAAGLRGAPRLVLAWGLAPVAVTPLLLRRAPARPAALAALLPAALYLNALLIEWASGLSGVRLSLGPE
jgi:hypothetical protein